MIWFSDKFNYFSFKKPTNLLMSLILLFDKLMSSKFYKFQNPFDLIIILHFETYDHTKYN
jgi:hypothetical protein